MKNPTPHKYIDKKFLEKTYCYQWKDVKRKIREEPRQHLSCDESLFIIQKLRMFRNDVEQS
ncbi:hypothetical protein U14_05190 [Candidatus Moduliflexus flocculans]|uniref:Uncharacterized protein n=1 Tax=Candidatus Moduliflexus flocculans TaxID=1499966 RepID=A0A081BR84_9BACT|nr:hypothetical protein U14_05190 [Candidatus Moduliflexus flocculans]